jgi:hypothetical protein
MAWISLRHLSGDPHGSVPFDMASVPVYLALAFRVSTGPLDGTFSTSAQLSVSSPCWLFAIRQHFVFPLGHRHVDANQPLIWQFRLED